MDFTQIIAQLTAVSLVLVPVNIGLTEIAKMFISARRAAPASLILGIGLSFIFPAATLSYTILQGILIGLTASGLYSNVKSVVSK